MALSVRVDPLLEKDLERAARQRGVTKSQFVIEAIERALGRKDPVALAEKLIAEEEARTDPAVRKAFEGYGPAEIHGDEAREFIRKKLRAKHGVGRTR